MAKDRVERDEEERSACIWTDSGQNVAEKDDEVRLAKQIEEGKAERRARKDRQGLTAAKNA